MEKWCLEHPVVYTSTALVIWQGFYTVAPNKRNPPKHTILTCCSTCISCPWQPLTGTFPLILTHFVLLRSCTLHYRNVAVLDQPLLNPLALLKKKLHYIWLRKWLDVDSWKLREKCFCYSLTVIFVLAQKWDGFSWERQTFFVCTLQFKCGRTAINWPIHSSSAESSNRFPARQKWHRFSFSTAAGSSFREINGVTH